MSYVALTERYWEVLEPLLEGDKTGPELCEITGKAKGGMGHTLSLMIQMGLIKCVRQCRYHGNLYRAAYKGEYIKLPPRCKTVCDLGTTHHAEYFDIAMKLPPFRGQPCQTT